MEILNISVAVQPFLKLHTVKGTKVVFWICIFFFYVAPSFSSLNTKCLLPHSVFCRKYSFRFRRSFGNFITFGKVSTSCTMTFYEKTKWTKCTQLYFITSFNSSEQLLACASWDFDSGDGVEKCFRLVQF